MQECCRTGFHWNGTASGRTDKIQLQEPNTELDVYIAGSNSEKALIIYHDALGWALNNTRLLADHFAKELGVTVYLPDL